MDAEFLRLASLGDMLKFHNKVMLDTPPYNTEYLDDILAAIDKQYLLMFKYVSGFGAERYRAATGFREILQATMVRCGSEETTFGVRRESQFKCRGRCEETR